MKAIHTLAAAFSRRAKLLSTDLLPADNESPPKNVCPVIHVLAPAREGGLERVVEMVAAGQRFEGVHVACVLAPAEAPNHPFVRRLAELGIPTTRVIVGARNYWREFRSLRALIAQLNPRVVHTHGYRADLTGGAAARSLAIPTVSTVHGFVGGTLRNRFNEAVQCVALRRADGVIAVSSPLVEQLAARRIPKYKIRLVRNGFSATAPTETRADARRTLGLARDTKVVGWIGRLSREKGADVMLNAFSLYDRSSRLSIIGEGPEREHLMEQAARLGIAERVTWHGAIARAGTLLPAFDAFVLSSRTEGTPIVLFEAMHAGVPIVATTVGGVPDVVSSDQALLIPPEDPSRLASALGELATNPDSALTRSRSARERLRASFDVAVWLSEMESVYRESAKKKPREAR
jgi:glycosyltransferase involved in cell wall biosynthesis